MPCVRRHHHYPDLVRVNGSWAALASGLYRRVHVPSRDSLGGVLTAQRFEPLFDWIVRDANDAIQEVALSRALIPALNALAERHQVPLNYRANVEQDGRVPLGPPDSAAVDRIAQIQPVDQNLLRLVAEHGRGLVECARGVRPTRMAAEVAAAYPTTRIVVVASNKQQVARVVGDCDALGVPTYRLRSGGVPERWASVRVIVTTPMQASAIPQKNLELLIVLDAMAGLGNDYQLDRAKCSRAIVRRFQDERGEAADSRINEPRRCLRWITARRLGFIRAGEHRSPGEEATLRRIYGFAETTVYANGRESTRIEFERITIRRGPRIRGDVAGVTHRRRLIWMNHLRNRILARKALEAADSGRVVVLVDGVEQAAAMALELPGWPVCLATDAELGGLSRRMRTALTSATQMEIRPCKIATLAASRTVNLDEFDTVVRAYARTGCVPCLGEQPGVVSGSRRTIRLIDVDDRFDIVLRNESCQRFRTYRRHGWFNVGEDPIMGRAEILVEQSLRAIEQMQD